MFRPGIHLPARTAGIFFSTKHRDILYWIVGQYGIYRPYQPVQYEIDLLRENTQMNGFFFFFLHKIQNLKLNNNSKVINN